MFLLLIGLLAIGYVVYKLKEDSPEKEPWVNKARVEPKVEPIRRRPSLHSVDASPPYADGNKQPITPAKVDKSSDKVEHKRSEYLTSKNERNFYIALRKALPDDYMIHCQTSLMALIQPVEWKNNSRTWAKRMDFVVTDSTTKIICVIELDDRSHERADRKKRDKYVNEALDGQHKLIRFKASWGYDAATIYKKLRNKIDCL
ncbi:DUF2726 domain-containing protein [Vibrio gallaecicus]|uniref:DUF2726 domain-containing protein n=1 Tax=Vibrio gallaecicus TaxID=552386 RepID=UPI001F10A02C|nr:DUF2726 domain-containing protein [Vibrio gallaecicus]